MAVEHVTGLIEQLHTMIAAGVDAGEFTVTDPGAVAGAVFQTTVAFHHPALAADWTADGIDTAFADVGALIISGHRA